MNLKIPTQNILIMVVVILSKKHITVGNAAYKIRETISTNEERSSCKISGC